MSVLPAGTVKRIHVDRRVIAMNRKHGTNDPAWTIQTSKGPIKCHWWNALGPMTGEAAGVPDVDGRVLKPLSCGARLWIRTSSQVVYR